MREPSPPRTTPVAPGDTATEMTWIVMPGQTNALGSVFGGQVMSWIDVCAAVSAQRFCRTYVVTAGIDQLSFLAPIRQGHVAVVRSMVNWAGRTSMEVGVRVEGEDPLTGVRTHTSSAYVTFVALDENHRKVRLPTLDPRTDDDTRRWREAEARRDVRLKARRELLASRGEA